MQRAKPYSNYGSFAITHFYIFRRESKWKLYKYNQNFQIRLPYVNFTMIANMQNPPWYVCQAVESIAELGEPSVTKKENKEELDYNQLQVLQPVQDSKPRGEKA
jgi:hypothetical protein